MDWSTWEFQVGFDGILRLGRTRKTEDGMLEFAVVEFPLYRSLDAVAVEEISAAVSQAARAMVESLKTRNDLLRKAASEIRCLGLGNEYAEIDEALIEEIELVCGLRAFQHAGQDI